MKKLISLFFAFVLTFSIALLTQHSAYATADTSSGSILTLKAGGNGKGNDTDGTLVKLSANVSAAYNTNGTGSNATKFSAATVNSQGTQEYGVASDMSVVKYQDVGTGKSASTQDVTNGDSADFNSWTSVGQ